MYVLLFFILCPYAFSQNEIIPRELHYLVDKTHSKTIPITLLNGLSINVRCMTNKKDCSEWIANKPKHRINRKKLTGNEASIYCEEKNGTSIILHDNKFNEYDYCRFGNEMMVDSWDLYEKNKK